MHGEDRRRRGKVRYSNKTMILYAAIKYKILDFCLERIFKAIGINFNNLKVEDANCRELSVGMKLKRLEFMGFWWDDVEILSITPNPEHPSLMFTITCSRYYFPYTSKPLVVSHGHPEQVTIFFTTKITIYK